MSTKMEASATGGVVEDDVEVDFEERVRRPRQLVSIRDCAQQSYAETREKEGADGGHDDGDDDEDDDDDEEEKAQKLQRPQQLVAIEDYVEIGKIPEVCEGDFMKKFNLNLSYKSRRVAEDADQFRSFKCRLQNKHQCLIR